MFIPSLTFTHTPHEGFTDDGEEVLGDSKKVQGSIINLRDRLDKSSVRADQTASRGRAEQYEADVRVLLVPGSDVKRDDLLSIDDWSQSTYQVSTVFPRFDLQGNLDHLQVDCVLWQ